jgi:hypothetical protein
MSNELLRQADLEMAQCPDQGMGQWAEIAGAVLGVGGSLFAAKNQSDIAKKQAALAKSQAKAALSAQQEAEKAAQAQLEYQTKFEAQQSELGTARTSQVLSYLTVGGIVAGGLFLAAVIFFASRPKIVRTK